MRKIGFLLSAGGSACFKGIDLAQLEKDDVAIIVDRECGAADGARNRGLDLYYAAGTTRGELSQSVLDIALGNDVDCLVMLFSRLVGRPLLGSVPVLNIHPSLLPSFPGLDGVAPAAQAYMPFQGATLHVADEGMDTGPVLAQAVSAVHGTSDIGARHSIAFALKSTLVALAIDWWRERVDFAASLTDLRKGLPAPAAYNSFVSHGFFDRALEGRSANLLEKKFLALSR
ncbi:formyltransferase family protein [Parasphingorhabdus sp.]|uniref:formyltransferase family protein n=1 Tax=Parasphingorhabdus sp. TaxID=2709688 RepID=UPI0032EEB41B